MILYKYSKLKVHVQKVMIMKKKVNWNSNGYIFV